MSRQAAVVLVAAMLCVTAIGVSMIASNLALKKAYIAAGYTRTTLPGLDDPQWVKP